MSWRMNFFQAAKPSGPNYVKDGLVLWLDGIWNAGEGVHDPNAIEWKDLSGNRAFLGSGEWLPTAVRIKGREQAYKCPVDDIVDIINEGEATVEVCAIFTGQVRYYNPYIDINSGKVNPRPICIECEQGGFISCQIRANDYRERHIINLSPPLSVTLSGRLRDRQEWFIAGAPSGVGPIYDGVYSRGFTMEVGGWPFNTYSDVVIHSVRFYSRALTPEEIAQNYAVDKERFNLP